MSSNNSTKEEINNQNTTSPSNNNKKSTSPYQNLNLQKTHLFTTSVVKNKKHSNSLSESKNSFFKVTRIENCYDKSSNPNNNNNESENKFNFVNEKRTYSKNKKVKNVQKNKRIIKNKNQEKEGEEIEPEDDSKRKNGWTKEEDDLLIEKGKIFEEKNWKTISSFFPGRNPIQCSSRYHRIKPGLVKGHFTKEEDQKLIELYNIYGKKWNQISKIMKNRTGKQIRDRFLNSLQPGVCKQKFTHEEDMKILKYYKIYGKSWSSIAKYMKGRTGDMIKNRFYSNLYKNYNEAKEGIEDNKNSNNYNNILNNNDKKINNKEKGTGDYTGKEKEGWEGSINFNENADDNIIYNSNKKNFKICFDFDNKNKNNQFNTSKSINENNQIGNNISMSNYIYHNCNINNNNFVSNNINNNLKNINDMNNINNLLNFCNLNNLKNLNYKNDDNLLKNNNSFDVQNFLGKKILLPNNNNSSNNINDNCHTISIGQNNNGNTFAYIHSNINNNINFNLLSFPPNVYPPQQYNYLQFQQSPKFDNLFQYNNDFSFNSNLHKNFPFTH